MFRCIVNERIVIVIILYRKQGKITLMQSRTISTGQISIVPMHYIYIHKSFNFYAIRNWVTLYSIDSHEFLDWNATRFGADYDLSCPTMSSLSPVPRFSLC